MSRSERSARVLPTMEIPSSLPYFPYFIFFALKKELAEIFTKLYALLNREFQNMQTCVVPFPFSIPPPFFISK